MEVTSGTTTLGEEDLIDVDWFKDDFSARLAHYEELEQSGKQDSQFEGLNFDGISNLKTEKLCDNDVKVQHDDNSHGLNEQQVQEMQQPKRIQKSITVSVKSWGQCSK